jgi:hypothetical protein
MKNFWTANPAVGYQRANPGPGSGSNTINDRLGLGGTHLLVMP